MRLIDADALKAKQQEDADIFLSPIPNPINKIRRDEALNAVANIVNAPTIDAVPVVRCKDCKHRFDGCCYSRKSNQISFGAYVADDWFCAYGERKEGR